MIPDESGQVGLIGLGALGGRVAKRILASGRRLFVCDTNPTRVSALVNSGATSEGKVSVLGSRCSMILLALPTPSSVLEVVTGPDGLLSGGCRHGLVVDLSTNSPDMSRQLALACERSGNDFLDAPVTGGVVGAELGSLTVMVGGRAEDVIRATPVLSLFAARIVHVGPCGHGAATKLVHNMLGEIQVHAFAEALCLAAAVGLDLDKVYEVLAHGMATSRILTELYARGALRGNLDPSASVSTAKKDQELLAEMAEQAGLTLTFSPTVLQRLRTMMDRGLGAADVTATLLLYEEAFGVKVRVSEAALNP